MALKKEAEKSVFGLTQEIQGWGADINPNRQTSIPRKKNTLSVATAGPSRCD